MAVRTFRVDAAAIAEMDRALQLRVSVVAHCMATRTERFRVRHFERRVERAPEHHARDKPAERQEAQAVMHARTIDGSPVALEQRQKAGHRSLLVLASLARSLRPGRDTHIFDVRERVADQWLRVDLRDMALRAEIAPWRETSERGVVSREV